MLEVIDKGETSERHPCPLLFVHGAWHGAWCWDEYFLDFFAGRGFRVLAPSLRGHGGSPVEKSVRKCSISEFVRDVATVAQRLPRLPVPVGHSMGGFVVQKYLESHDAPAAVLISSAPPRGQLRSLIRSLRRHPWRSTKFAITGRPADLCGSPARTRELFFGSRAPDHLVEATAARLQPDSMRAMFFDMVTGDLVDTRKVNSPMLVMGGAGDQLYSAGDVRRTAAAYRTSPVFIPHAGHDVMLEPGWNTAAETIESWLGQHGL
ncbi:alpha/beta hydrolase [Mycobacterium asiaticum]|uniref:alpha/beta hydrolase n=1 Tax=Mycobacterium asiaticum TaxID=1790 RepID=UPI0007EFBE5E|nr:alpha/beta fold hydrolase [Mycobacterium asiaticum]OBI98056.1 alpha/beta hydrolase [Mycobacterium asiaticum]